MDMNGWNGLKWLMAQVRRWQRCMQQWILFCRWAALNLPWFWKNSRVSLESSYLGMGIPPYSSRWGCVSMQVTNVPKFQQITGVAFPACTFSHDSCLSYIKQSGILLAKCTNGNSFPFLSPKRNVRCQLHFHPEQSQATCKPNKKKWRFLEVTLHSGRPRKESLGALTRHWQELSKLDPLQHGITKATNPNPPRACKWQKLFGCHSSGSK